MLPGRRSSPEPASSTKSQSSFYQHRDLPRPTTTFDYLEKILEDKNCNSGFSQLKSPHSSEVSKEGLSIDDFESIQYLEGKFQIVSTPEAMKIRSQTTRICSLEFMKVQL